MGFEFCVLGSGSAGNCAVVRSGAVRLLIDAGLSAKQIGLRLAAAGVEPEELDGIVLTHEHGDHTRGLEVFLKRCPVPVYCNIRTREVLRQIGVPVEWRLFECGDGFEVGGLGVKTFYVPHDAVEPMGFVLRSGGRSLGILSDVGHATTLIKDHLRGVDAMFVEANYDDAMLQNDKKRPWSTKQRIASRHGHLSNAQTRDLICEVAEENLALVVLGHLSSDCNAPDVAIEAIREGLRGLQRDDVMVTCASPDEVTPFFAVGRGDDAGALPADLAGRGGPELETAGEGGVVAARVRETQPGGYGVGEELSPPWSAAQQSLF